ncbi:Golgi transport complex subunit 5-domain-containing protein [Lineolata rhizophorae]|uniref:Conserved oligomeric Golgi complex subunit 5 n=1 Tax=Lineolata rhizophorae TaxID=578093 RepID=A0A6A6P6Q3_9PEZI|nr:Golgi transport complex subunit 5-domain-containing protein [Lineolata rhizophorae]
MEAPAGDSEPSYIDYDAFLTPDFSATQFANSLVLSMNDPSDTPLDLSTPLSRVLFDVQEIDTHIDSLTTRSALPLLEHTRADAQSSGRILKELDAQLGALNEAYATLRREVLERHEGAELVRGVAERLCETVRLGRAVGRCLMLGRQLEVQMGEFAGSGVAGPAGALGSARREDHRAMVRAANTLVLLRQLLSATGKEEEGAGLDRVNAVVTLRTELIGPAERNVLSRAQQIVREFSMSSLLAASAQSQQSSSANVSAISASTFAQAEDTRSRATSALLTLYLLSPLPSKTPASDFEPTLLLSALQDYLQTALKSSLAALSRALATLPQLDRVLLEVSARCQNIVALETLLSATKPPAHPLVDASDAALTTAPTPPNFLTPLLSALDTTSLSSWFWRSLAAALTGRVAEILARGGVSARTLRSNRERVRDAVRDAVGRGARLPASRGGPADAAARGWEREAAVMVQAIVGAMGR